MTDKEQKAAARAFAEKWLKKEGYEKGETQQFWIDLLHDVFGIDRVTEYIEFEKRITMETAAKKGYIDGYIPSVPVLIEQKGSHVDIRKKEQQSDGTMLDPHGQAKRYVQWLGVSKRPKYIVVCNFKEFLIYDEENPVAEPLSVKLADFEREYYLLDFLVDPESVQRQKEEEISFKASEAVGKIYDALLKQYKDPKDPHSLSSLNKLCVRLVFCFYAEDAAVFSHLQFGKYLSRFDPRDVRRALIDLFKVLDTPEGERDTYLDEELKAFPYVNGGLFADENIEIPNFTDEIVHLIVNEASAKIDWQDISPTIFGGLFESTLNPETRRSGGMHYTSVENIHKVIDPLFLNGLKDEFTDIIDNKHQKAARINALKAFKKKLSSLVFLDPACGSGNFLTESYLSLRKLENRAIAAIMQDTYGAMIPFEGLIDGSEILVSIGQFYGIEINDFAVSVAKTALWIAEHQMLEQTRRIVRQDKEFLPLTSYPNIVEGNALRINWEDVVPKDKLNYIMGNPPFVGKKEQSKEQKNEILELFDKKIRRAGNLDYVTGWYYKSAKIIQNTNIKTAFVSTNSITQGEQVPILWTFLMQNNIHIEFAYRTFTWDNSITNDKGKKEKTDKKMAAVHCVIIGFSVSKSTAQKLIYDGDTIKQAKNINGYLINADDIIIESRSTPLSANAPKIIYGSMPIDNGHLILDKNDYETLIKESSDNLKYVRKYAGGNELINNIERWCLWLVDVTPSEIRKSSFISQRVKETADFRKSSDRPQTLALAATPYLFGEIRQPATTMIAIPKVSSESRRYIPLSYVSPDIIINGSALIIPCAEIYHFGVLMSSVHNAWMRAVGGRLEMRYQYSGSIVYNNFPWCDPTPEQKAKIEQTAQGILDARALYPDSSLADLYDELTMPPELRKAHKANDRAVMQAYGFNPDMTESEIVAELMKMYKALTE